MLNHPQVQAQYEKAQDTAVKIRDFQHLSFENKIEYIDELQRDATLSVVQATGGRYDMGAKALDTIEEMRLLFAVTCLDLQTSAEKNHAS